MEICPREQCAGCYACVNICPVQCISMKEDMGGFIYPVVDENKCIKCGKCKKVCFNCNTDIKFQQPKLVAAAWSSDERDRDTSSSGGIASVLSFYILQHGGIVFGAAYDENNEVSHICIDKDTDIWKLKGSKYVHSYINDTFQQCKQYLLNGKLVLFIGTPCQIEGLKKFLNKDYANLYMIDIICHGVPSHKMLKEHLEYVTEYKDLNGQDISFRNNTDFRLKISHDNIILYDKIAAYDLYLKSFLDTAIFRENCYQCQFARSERVTDITIGDFWGLKKELAHEEFDKGISCILINSDKGMKLFNKIQGNIIFYKRTLDEAVAGNDQLRQPAVKDYKHDCIMKYIENGDTFDDAVYKIYRTKLRKQRLKDNIKNIDKIIHIPIVKTMLRLKYKIRG